VLVSEVLIGTISEASGIKAGDIITKINLKEVGRIQEFEEIFDKAKAGDSLRILLFRDEKFQEVNLFLKP
jgi:S1-C subfamily serine protease